MTLILSGTDGLSDVDGSAATPAIRGTDANTGIFFPAADQVAITTGGTQRAVVDASGNVGIGAISPNYKLEVNSGSTTKVVYFGSTGTNTYTPTASTSLSNTTLTLFGGNASGATTGIRMSQGSNFELYMGGVQESGGAAAFVVQGYSGSAYAERMRIDSSGNVGIGTSSPANKLHVVGTEYASVVETASSTDGVGIRFAIKSPVTQGQLELDWYNDSTRTGGGYGMIQVGKTNNSPDFSIMAGRVLVATSTFVSGQNGVLVRGSAGGYTDEVLQTRTAGTASTSATGFYNNNGRVGTISTSGTATAYNTSSDYRLKNSIAPMTSALDKVTQLKPCTYKWNVDGSEGQGFIAHELAEIVPQCVHGEKDAVETYTDEDGNEQTRPVYQGVDTSFLVATLTAAIQELKAIVDAQAVEIASLKGTP